MPHLGGKARDDVTPDDVRRMLAALKKSGLSDGTVSRTLDVARQLLPKAATDGVRYRIKERRRMQVATRKQAAAIESATDARYRLLVRTAFTTGARWGELTAIRGTDVEKRGPGYIVKIQRTIEEIGTTFTERGYGKTAAAVRDISVPEDIARSWRRSEKSCASPGREEATSSDRPSAGSTGCRRSRRPGFPA